MRRKSVLTLVAVAIAVALGSSGGCGTPQGSGETGTPKCRRPQIDAKAAAAKAIEMYDSDLDGKLSGKELDKCPGLKAAVRQMDPTGRGGITAEMIVKRIMAWYNAKVGTVSIGCLVTRNGVPLPGVGVTFVPEEFLGLDSGRWSAKGTTDANGVAMMSIPDQGGKGVRGVVPGFYRVKITKVGAGIPARYNSNTILGYELSLDTFGAAKEPIKFDLNF